LKYVIYLHHGVVVVWSMNTYFIFVANSDYFLIEVKQQ